MRARIQWHQRRAFREERAKVFSAENPPPPLRIAETEPSTSPETIALVVAANKHIAVKDPARFKIVDGIHLALK